MKEKKIKTKHFKIMKKIFFMLLLCVYGIKAQDKFVFNNEGFTDYVAADVPGTQSEIYAKTLNWVKETYKNPDVVLKMKIENEKIRIEGFKESFLCTKIMGGQSCSNATYTIEISFKDGRYKFDPTALVLSNSNGHNYTVDLNNTSKTYYKNGKIVKGSEGIDSAFENFYNGLNESLKDYISNDKQSDW